MGTLVVVRTSIADRRDGGADDGFARRGLALGVARADDIKPSSTPRPGGSRPPPRLLSTRADPVTSAPSRCTRLHALRSAARSYGRTKRFSRHPRAQRRNRSRMSRAR